MKKLTLITAMSIAMGIGLAHAGGDVPGAAPEPDTMGGGAVNESTSSTQAPLNENTDQGTAASGMSEESTSGGAVGGAAVSTDTSSDTSSESLATESTDQSGVQQSTASQQQDPTSGGMQSVSALSFEDLDVNKDGKIDPTEADRYRGLNRAFDKSDVNRTGGIEEYEFYAYQQDNFLSGGEEASLAAAEFSPDTTDSLNARNVESSSTGSSGMSSHDVSSTVGSSSDPALSGGSLQARYQSLDVNRDGKIDPTEADRSSSLTKAYDRFDTNKTGAIELHEFSAFEVDMDVGGQQ